MSYSTCVIPLQLGLWPKVDFIQSTRRADVVVISGPGFAGRKTSVSVARRRRRGATSRGQRSLPVVAVLQRSIDRRRSRAVLRVRGPAMHWGRRCGPPAIKSAFEGSAAAPRHGRGWPPSRRVRHRDVSINMRWIPRLSWVTRSAAVHRVLPRRAAGRGAVRVAKETKRSAETVLSFSWKALVTLFMRHNYLRAAAVGARGRHGANGVRSAEWTLKHKHLLNRLVKTAWYNWK